MKKLFFTLFIVLVETILLSSQTLDKVNSIIESNYENNTAFFSLRIGNAPKGPDLIIERILSPQHTVGSPSGSWNFNFRVVNIGPRGNTASPSKAKIYLSKDALVSRDDLFLSSVNVPTLASGESYDAYPKINIPSGVDFSSFCYILILADADNVISENVESNNTNYFSLHIGSRTNYIVDLIVEEITSPQHTVLSPSGSWDITYKVINAGPGAAGSAGATITKIYLSNDNKFSNDDKMLLEVPSPVIASGTYTSFTSSIYIPRGITNGYYYILVVANADYDNR